MKTKGWAWGTLAAFVVIFVLDMGIHGMLLTSLYQETAHIWRPQHEAGQMVWLMTVGQFVFARLLVMIYTKGYEPNTSGLDQGLRFGLLAGFLVSVSYVSVWYVVLPIPLTLALAWFSAGAIDCVAAGAVIGLLYRPQS